ncbi:protein of unassigned function [Methylobacterium oryzae CBMB20]|uniref:Protein of unassigned function n=1 Tax=Methylobacterium oryzae CBMB20 TaxID=693986 RepID=A0A089Q819_9HYPH|nr:protein of unassigned function [Methylobacterium oryzae CBMB20]
MAAKPAIIPLPMLFITVIQWFKHAVRALGGSELPLSR